MAYPFGEHRETTARGLTPVKTPTKRQRDDATRAAKITKGYELPDDIDYTNFEV